jgi:hypothetical protein
MHDELKTEFSRKAGPTLTVDWQLYAQHLEDSDLSDEDKREVIEALWTLVVSFIDMGFGVGSPAQACGKTAQHSPSSAAGVLPSLQDHWNEAATKSGTKAAGPKPPRRSI